MTTVKIMTTVMAIITLLMKPNCEVFHAMRSIGTQCRVHMTTASLSIIQLNYDTDREGRGVEERG